MRKSTLLAAGAIIMVLVFVLGTQFSGIVTAQDRSQGSSDSSPRTITVSGQGVVTATPDIVKTEIGVIAFHANLETALAEANTKMTAILNALKALGISESDIQTAQFNVSVQRENYYGPITGYDVSNTVRITIRDLSQAGAILDGAVKAGANQIYSVYFAIQDSTALAEQARNTAVATAFAKAGQIAAAAGVKLGRILTIYTDANPVPFLDSRSLLSADYAAVPLQAGQLDLSASVQVVFEIE